MTDEAIDLGPALDPATEAVFTLSGMFACELLLLAEYFADCYDLSRAFTAISVKSWTYAFSSSFVFEYLERIDDLDPPALDPAATLGALGATQAFEAGARAYEPAAVPGLDTPEC